MSEAESKRLYFVNILARPTEHAEDYGQFGGAYVNCWVDAGIESEAVALAEQAVRQSEWLPLTIEQVCQVTRESYEDDDSGLEYYEQALTEGMMVVFNTWPNEEQAADELH